MSLKLGLGAQNLFPTQTSKFIHVQAKQVVRIKDAQIKGMEKSRRDKIDNKEIYEKGERALVAGQIVCSLCGDEGLLTSEKQGQQILT